MFLIKCLEQPSVIVGDNPMPVGDIPILQRGTQEKRRPMLNSARNISAEKNQMYATFNLKLRVIWPTDGRRLALNHGFEPSNHGGIVFGTEELSNFQDLESEYLNHHVA